MSKHQRKQSLTAENVGVWIGDEKIGTIDNFSMTLSHFYDGEEVAISNGETTYSAILKSPEPFDLSKLLKPSHSSGFEPWRLVR